MASELFEKTAILRNDDDINPSSTGYNHRPSYEHNNHNPNPNTTTTTTTNSGTSTPSRTSHSQSQSSITSKPPRLSSSSYAPYSLSAHTKEQSHTHLKKLKEDHGLMTLRYEEAVYAKPPIPVTVAPPRKPPTDLHPALRARREEGKLEEEEAKRDSAVAEAGSLGGNTLIIEVREEEVGEEAEGNSGKEEEVIGVKEEKYRSELTIDFDSGNDVHGLLGAVGEDIVAPQTPTREDIHTAEAEKAVSPSSLASRTGSMRQWIRSRTSKKEEAVAKTPKRKSDEQINEAHENAVEATPEPDQERTSFSPLTTPIPSAGFMEDEFLDTMSFSKRGSIMFGGKKGINGHLRFGGGRRQQSISMLVTPTALTKVLSEDVEIESQKVRSMYEQETPQWEDGRYSSLAQRMEMGEVSEDPFVSNGLLSPGIPERPDSQMSHRNEHELAGGIEDWEDVNGGDVDRYGFISKPRSDRPGTPEYRPPQRVSTVLHLASETPRKKRGFGRSASNATARRQPGRKISQRSLHTQASTSSMRSISRVRSITNRLPGNADRRCVDEAGDMLTLPPGLADIAEDEEGGRAVADLKRKEIERAEKWRKMARIKRVGKNGEGMEFEFDARSPKLIERTWKGIPDRWRAAAWYSFMASSAKKRRDSPSEQDIILAFHELIKVSSADDQQIDTDVPRTINSHIMFRKRYRGGQRLLFRVLHCLSLYFPDTGYVQGMASLAATLLCYYDEEKCFVMLVRMWTLRGLAELYAAGFGGLMAALEELRGKWMRGREVTVRLDELGIEPTSYGTRWYLTLFGYSIPFPAQLRVWDVFMLLGDSDPIPNSHPHSRLPVSPSLPTFPSTPNSPSTFTTTTTTIPASPSRININRSVPPSPSVAHTDDHSSILDERGERKVDFHGGLDILHATSAALIDGTREILLDSDFENAMKVLTSWIPVKDEELLMRVAKAEWKLIRGRRGRR